ncbi:MAG TPA: hypothetical protein PLP17_02400 [Oligoflexia bacterium]|nr:hypothetical protein [Oligoflexia bacterium]
MEYKIIVRRVQQKENTPHKPEEKEMTNRTCARTQNSFSRAGTFAYIRLLGLLTYKSAEAVMLIGLMLLALNLPELAYAEGGTFREACNSVLGLAEGAFGALVASVAGVAAIISAATGAYRAAWNLLIVSVGAFILRSFVSIFSGVCTP